MIGARRVGLSVSSSPGTLLEVGGPFKALIPGRDDIVVVFLRSPYPNQEGYAMKDIYVVVPKGTEVFAAADDFQRASMSLADLDEEDQRSMEIVNVDLLEEGD